MRIGHLLDSYSAQGGISSYVRRVIGAQLGSGHDVVLFDRSVLVASPNGLGFPILPAPDDDELLRTALALKIDILHAHTSFGLRSRCDLSIVRTLHDHNAYCPSGSRYLARRGQPCPRSYGLLGCVSGHLLDHCGSVRPAKMIGAFRRMWLEQETLPNQHCIAISMFSKTQMLRSGFESSNVTVVYNPAPSARPVADLALRSADRRPPRFVFIGRLVPEKGLEWLIRAATRVRCEVCFEIIGDGYDRSRLFELTKSLHIAERFTWTSWLKENELSAKLSFARAVLFPSLWHEPAGLVTLESAAAGRSLIASNVGGIPEYATKLGHTMLIKPNDIDELAAAISRLAENPDEAEERGRIGWQAVRDGAFHISEHIRELDQIYSAGFRRNKTSD